MSTLSVSSFVVCVAPQYNIMAAAYKNTQRISADKKKYHAKTQ